MAAVFSDMWNLAITIITPVFKYGLDLFHTKEDPDIVLICNGGGYMDESKRSTHFSSTRPIGEYRKPGRDLVNKTIGINPDLVYKKLEPVIVDNAQLTRQLAIDEYITDEKEKSLQLLFSMTRNIEKLDNHIAELIRESDKKKEQKKRYEYLMESLDISSKKIKIAAAQKEMPYMLTEEREKEEIQKERKWKREEEDKEKERKKQKVVETRGGKITGEAGEIGEGEVVEGSLAHDLKVISQQTEMLRSQELIMQRQENQIIQMQLKIREFEQQQQQQLLPSIPSLSSLEVLDDICRGSIWIWETLMVMVRLGLVLVGKLEEEDLVLFKIF